MLLHALKARYFPLQISVLHAPEQTRTQKIWKMLSKSGQFIFIHEHAVCPGRNLPTTLDCRKQNASPRAFKSKWRQYSLRYRLRIQQAQRLFQQPRSRAYPGFAGQNMTTCGKIPTIRIVQRLPGSVRQPQPPATVTQVHQRHTVRQVLRQGCLCRHQQQRTVLLIKYFNQSASHCGQAGIGRMEHGLS